jgi:hypothetical protein
LPEWAELRVWSSSLTLNLGLNLAEHPERAAVEFWENLFNRVRGSGWLNGPDFRSRSLAWLLKPKNVDDLLNGRRQGARAKKTSLEEDWEYLQSADA